MYFKENNKEFLIKNNLIKLDIEIEKDFFKQRKHLFFIDHNNFEIGFIFLYKNSIFKASYFVFKSDFHIARFKISNMVENNWNKYETTADDFLNGIYDAIEDFIIAFKNIKSIRYKLLLSEDENSVINNFLSTKIKEGKVDKL